MRNYDPAKNTYIALRQIEWGIHLYSASPRQHAVAAFVDHDVTLKPTDGPPVANSSTQNAPSTGVAPSATRITVTKP